MRKIGVLFVLIVIISVCMSVVLNQYLVTYKMATNEDELQKLGDSVLIVDKEGKGNFKKISDAVYNAEEGTTILVMPGIYEEEVHAFNHNVNIVGVDKNSCILKNGYGDYSRPPLEMNIGSVRNMTIIADTYDSTSSEEDNTQSKPYGIHVECSHGVTYTLRIEDCIIKSKWNAGIGIGVRYNQTVVIKNCEIETECNKSWTPLTDSWIKQGAIFFHNDAVNTNMSVENTSNIIVEGCILKGANASLSMYCADLANELSATFINNTLYDSENGVSNNTIYRRQTDNLELCGKYIKLNEMSHGNNVDILNH